MLRNRRIEVAWTSLVIAIAVLGLMTSEGEPVCEGPFILRVDDSLPPQCPSPTEVLPQVALVWAVGLAAVLLIRAVAQIRPHPAGANP